MECVTFENHSILPDNDLYPLLELRHSDPHRVLGFHPLSASEAVLRVWYPGAHKVKWVAAWGSVDLPCVEERGLFELTINRDQNNGTDSYVLEITDVGGTRRVHDPYSFEPQISDLDLYLHAEGRDWESYHHLGAHPRTVAGVAGTCFAVWAPNAQRVSVVGDFNNWDGRFHMMRRLGASGIWEIFIPEVAEGAHYKYEIRGPQGDVFLKTDPYGVFAQHDLRTACMVYDLGRYQWSDHDWMTSRASKNEHQEPLSIYEVHLGSWRRVPEENNRPLSYLELAEQLVDYVKKMGFTHVEFMPVMEHPFEGSWGYQIVNFFAPSSRFGKPDDFRHLVDRLHQAGIGVILDWVPGHFPRDAHGLRQFDGTALYEYADPNRAEHRDWGTLIFNYARHEVRNFLIANALYWFAEYHIDGLRVDAVASMLYLDYSRKEGEWTPNIFGGRENLEAVDFIKSCNEICYLRHPGIMMIAEESTAWPAVSKPTYDGGLGFGFKWNMGWMNDSLRYISRSPIHRKHHQGEITFSMLYAYHEHFILVLSHDEVTHGKGSLLHKMPEDDWQKFANLRLFLSWMWGHPGKKLLFQGSEIASWREWDHAQSLDWHLLQHSPHQGMQLLVQELNRLYRQEPSFWLLDNSPEGFEWIDFNDSENTVWSFLRKSPNTSNVIVLVNATPVPRYGYRLGVPSLGNYEIIFNSDAPCFGGSGMVLPPSLHAEQQHCHRFWSSIVIDLPPLSTLYLKVPHS
jgi:1,4-alpha-glucan branching enzyme